MKNYKRKRKEQSEQKKEYYNDVKEKVNNNLKFQDNKKSCILAYKIYNKRLHYTLMKKNEEKKSILLSQNLLNSLSIIIIFTLLFPLYIEAQLASSPNYILRTSNTGEAHSSINSSSFKIESTNYGLTATIGESAVTSASQLISSNYKIDIGFTPTWNLPPKIITNLTFPNNDRYLYTSKPPFLFTNAGDWDYTNFGINDKLHFEIKVSTDQSFSTVNYLASTTNSLLNWYTTLSGDANNCLFNQVGCIPFTSEGVDSSLNGSIKHITLTDLPLNNYYWKVKAYDDFEYSEDSSKPIFHYILPIVATTSPTNGQTINGTSTLLGWQEPPGANKYQVQLSRTCDFSDAIDYFVNSPNISLNLTNLQDGKYCWRIRPYDILGNPSNYTSTLVFFIITIPVIGVRLLAEFYVVPPQTQVLLRAYLLGPQDQIVNILNASDIDIFISGKNPPGDPGTLSDKKFFSDRIEITYLSPLSAGITSITARENRSSHGFTDTINIGTFGTLLMLEGQFNPKSKQVKVDEEVVIANFKFWAISENAKLNDLYIQLPPLKVSKILKKIRLVEDINNDGKYTEGVDRLLKTINRNEFDPSIVVFSKIVELLPRNSPLNYLLLGTFTSESTEGDFYIDFIPANSGNAWGLVSNTPLPIEGVSFRSGPFSVRNNKKTYSCNWATSINLSSRQFSAPITNVQAIRILVSAIDSPCIWNNPTVRISGTGSDNIDISSVKLIEDTNSNGIYEPTIDRIITSGKFLSNDGALTLPISISLNTGATKYFFILMDIPNSSNNASYQVYLKRNEQNVVINGSSSKFTGLDFLYGTFLTNISSSSQGFVNIINNFIGSAQKSLKPNSANEVMSFTLYNSNLKDVHFKKLKIELAIDPLYTSFITYGNLYLDVNKNGRIENTEDVLLEKKLFIPNGSTIPSIEFTEFDVTIPQNEYRSFVISFDLTVVFNVSISMRTIIQDSGSLTITGSAAAEIEGLPLSSEQQVLEKSGDLAELPPGPPSFGGGGGGCFIQPQPKQNTQNNSNSDFLFVIILMALGGGIIIRKIDDKRSRKFLYGN